MNSSVYECQRVWVGFSRFVVTFRTVDGGRHRFEHESTGESAAESRVRRGVARAIALRFAPGFVVEGSTAIQRVRA